MNPRTSGEETCFIAQTYRRSKSLGVALDTYHSFSEDLLRDMTKRIDTCFAPSQGLELLDVPTVAHLFGLTEGAIRKQLRNNRLPGVKVGKRWLVRRTALDRWFEEREGGRARPAESPIVRSKGMSRVTAADVLQALAP